MVKAVNIAKKSEWYVSPSTPLISSPTSPVVAVPSFSYHFLVFNASVLMWGIVRPFQQTGYERVYASQLQTVLKVLEETHEKDYQWRLELMRCLLSVPTIITTVQ